MGCSNSSEAKENVNQPSQPLENPVSPPKNSGPVNQNSDSNVRQEQPLEEVSISSEDNEPVRPVRRSSQLDRTKYPQNSNPNAVSDHYPMPRGTEASFVDGPLRRSSVMGTQTHNLVSSWEHNFKGPGVAPGIKADQVYRCFDEGNGLLFRVVDQGRRTWAFYNDTSNYNMKIFVTFGHESSISAMGPTKKIVLNEETGSCRLEATVQPGKTILFMAGEYNGFKTVYEADPL